MALTNLLKCWRCDNVDLDLLWISRVLGTKRQYMMGSSKKNIERVDFLQIRHFFVAEMKKAGLSRENTVKTLSSNM